MEYANLNGNWYLSRTNGTLMSLGASLTLGIKKVLPAFFTDSALPPAFS
jgi:hypothetical protein